MRADDIYEAHVVEALAVGNETDAYKYADQWLEAIARTPEMATDRETVSSWFAVSIEQGRDAGLKLANDTTKLALIGPVLETAMKAITMLVEERFGAEAHETATNIAIEVCMSAANAAGFDVSYDPEGR
jgi:hypothetical protein